jgi:hypothetical protein
MTEEVSAKRYKRRIEMKSIHSINHLWRSK